MTMQLAGELPALYELKSARGRLYTMGITVFALHTRLDRLLHIHLRFLTYFTSPLQAHPGRGRMI